MNIFRAISRKGAALISCTAVLCAAQSPGPLPSSLRWYAQIAKQRGQNSLSLSYVETHDYTPDLQKTMASTTLLRGTVLAHTTDASDGFKIRQWYKVKVSEGGKSLPLKSSGDSREISPHAAIKSNFSDEAVIYTDGGTAVIDGVAITQPGLPQLNIGTTYLFFLVPHANGVYSLGFNTKPFPIDSSGSLSVPDSDSSKFAKQMRVFRTYSEVKSAAAQIK